jgi:hypothetical protein
MQEVRRIRSEHLDDPACIVNGRVKGSLKVTRAFGAGYLKEVCLSVCQLSSKHYSVSKYKTFFNTIIVNGRSCLIFFFDTIIVPIKVHAHMYVTK